MGPTRPRPRLTLDAGALIGLERRDRRAVVLVEEQAKAAGEVVLPAAALAQVWRDGRRQAVLSRLVTAPTTVVPPLDLADSRAVGVLLAMSGSNDIADAHVALCALRAGGPVATTDPDDLLRIAPRLHVVAL